MTRFIVVNVVVAPSACCERVVVWLKAVLVFLFSFEILFCKVFPRLIRGNILTFLDHIGLGLDLRSDLIDRRLIHIFVEEDGHGYICLGIFYDVVKVDDNRKEDTEQKDTGSHGCDGCQREHLVSPDVFDTLFDAVAQCTKPHGTRPPSHR